MTGEPDRALDAAIDCARRALGVDAGERAGAWRVDGIRTGTRGYVLVVFGAPERVTAIAAIDAASGEVLESARLPARGAHALIGAEEAMRRANVGAGAEMRLVWEPSPATRSRFYPLWEVRRGGRVAWVDSVRGVVWRSLDAERGGG